MARRQRYIETYKGRRIVERWTERDTLDEGVDVTGRGYWTEGMTGFPRASVAEVRTWIDD